MAHSALTYSIAIRTLGTAGEKFREELLSITRQTIQPERVMVYIAEGYPRPSYTIGREEYVWVKKGMMAQRILPYDEITSDCILMLDDDVRLANDSAERLLQAMAENNADCVGADTFKNHEMSLAGKAYAAVTNLVFPHCSKVWAFKIHRNGSFSYNNHPDKSFYLSQSCAGPASIWRKTMIATLHLEDELWIDRLGFAYGDDALLFNKVYKNGYRLGVLYNSGIENLDAGTSSNSFKKGNKRMYVRTLANFAIWWRICFRNGGTSEREQLLAACCYGFKALWQFVVILVGSIALLRPKMLWQYLNGLADGWNLVRSVEFRSLGSYIKAK